MTTQRNKKKHMETTETEKTMIKRQNRLVSGTLNAVIEKLAEQGHEKFSRGVVSKVINKKLPVTPRNVVILEAFNEVSREWSNRLNSVQ